MNSVSRIGKVLESRLKIVIFTLYDLIYVFFAILKRENVQLPKNARLSKCLIIGNGPSLKDTLKNHKSEFKKYDIFCVNLLSLTDWFCKLKPINYVLLDPAFWDDSFHKNITHANDLKNCIQNLSDKTDWIMNLYIPFKARNSETVQLLSNNNNIKICFFHNYSLKGSFKNIFCKKNFGIIGGYNVLHACLTLSINLKYKEVYIVGADHSWFENVLLENNRSYMMDKHFYENEVSYIKRYHEKGDLANGLISLGKCLASYYEHDYYAKTNNVSVFNSSERSFIDAFEYKKLN